MLRQLDASNPAAFNPVKARGFPSPPRDGGGVVETMSCFHWGQISEGGLQFFCRENPEK